jgi:hypothetical protein
VCLILTLQLCTSLLLVLQRGLLVALWYLQCQGIKLEYAIRIHSVLGLFLDGWTMFKRTYGRWGLKDGEGKPKIETCGGE